jgi:hypothetical protein
LFASFNSKNSFNSINGLDFFALKFMSFFKRITKQNQV